MVSCWETHTYDGFFSIDLPLGTRPGQEDDGTTLTFPIPTCPHSEVIAGVFPSPNDESVTLQVLRNEIERFMTRCVGANKACFETPADFDKEGYVAYQAVGIDASGRWWLARLYGRRGGKMMLLVHWVGHEEGLRELVLPAFVSIDPILTTGSSTA